LQNATIRQHSDQILPTGRHGPEARTELLDPRRFVRLKSAPRKKQAFDTPSPDNDRMNDNQDSTIERTVLSGRPITCFSSNLRPAFHATGGSYTASDAKVASSKSGNMLAPDHLASSRPVYRTHNYRRDVGNWNKTRAKLEVHRPRLRPEHTCSITEYPQLSTIRLLGTRILPQSYAAVAVIPPTSAAVTLDSIVPGMT
jgi:hypothetical protein